MKAISIRPDYAWDILTENKKFEYRTWDTKHRGDLLICATARKIPKFISKHAIAVVSLTDVKKLSDGTYAWKLENVRCIKPFHVKGQQGLFNVNDSLIEYPAKNEVTIENGEEIVNDEFWKHYYEALVD
ncbi:ASCH domain-containing protein [Enterococcus sp. DIV0800]|uniref:ASCH domain-containing protein n=1 Tax=unclassified Enterococcus TaxID=2608891 RepID=UPI003D2FDA9D